LLLIFSLPPSHDEAMCWRASTTLRDDVSLFASVFVGYDPSVSRFRGRLQGTKQGPQICPMYTKQIFVHQHFSYEGRPNIPI
jgi:hypothetical protein